MDSTSMNTVSNTQDDGGLDASDGLHESASAQGQQVDTLVDAIENLIGAYLWVETVDDDKLVEMHYAAEKLDYAKLELSQRLREALGGNNE